MLSKNFKGHSIVAIKSRIYLDKKRFSSSQALMFRVPLEELHKPGVLPFLHIHLT